MGMWWYKKQVNAFWYYTWKSCLHSWWAEEDAIANAFQAWMMTIMYWCEVYFFTICWCLQRFSRQLKIFTIFHCSLHYNRTFWSITSRCKGQHLKLIFCVFIKPSENSFQCRSTVNGQASCWPRRFFFLVKQFKSFNYSISGVCWW